ncbi:copper amine oxidase N-terminal domain-containing protein [Paenibacillus vini]|uniref:copper amine oxidase N-terminal domain-containing protein n=1 Tax=Paenibacillus vini TaxID=1476024 RepID=UPI0025B7123F|nr:copper amine oxidase N-terminal domain-containing protein [Paenibacillus vini]MDN4068707.1 copper amine oxidase N-terminal domain-containing protein [Paenibacillus vini]
MMKRKIGTVMAMILFLVSAVPMMTSAAPLALRVEVNGERIYFPDEQPYVDKAQRVQVPVRFVSEALNAKVDWTAATKTVTVKLDSNLLTLVLGKKEYDVNGKKLQMDTAATRVGGRTFVPLRFVSEGLGASVKWDSKVSTVYISTSGFVDDVKKPETDETKNEVYEETIHGFKVKQNTGSELRIYEGSGTGDTALFSLSITFSTRGADYGMQVQEVEDILSQKVETKTVQSIMNYVKTKKKEEPELPLKIFKDNNYQIFVISNINSDIVVTIFNKE